MTDAVPYLMRDAGPADAPFIVNGWVREMRHSPWARHVPNGVYEPCQHELVHQVLAGSSAIVACNRDNPEHLYGCIVHSGRNKEYARTWSNRSRIVHWVYVKGAYRGLGLGRALLFASFDGGQKPDEIVCTQASQLLANKDLVARYNVIYSPYLLLGIPLPSAAPEDAAASEHANG